MPQLPSLFSSWYPMSTRAKTDQNEVVSRGTMAGGPAVGFGSNTSIRARCWRGRPPQHMPRVTEHSVILRVDAIRSVTNRSWRSWNDAGSNGFPSGNAPSRRTRTSRWVRLVSSFCSMLRDSEGRCTWNRRRRGASEVTGLFQVVEGGLLDAAPSVFDDGEFREGQPYDMILKHSKGDRPVRL